MAESDTGGRMVGWIGGWMSKEVDRWISMDKYASENEVILLRKLMGAQMGRDSVVNTEVESTLAKEITEPSWGSFLFLCRDIVFDSSLVSSGIHSLDVSQIGFRLPKKLWCHLSWCLCLPLEFAFIYINSDEVEKAPTTEFGGHTFLSVPSKSCQ